MDRTLKARMSEFAYAQVGEVLLRRDFNCFGSRSQVGRALAEMVAEGALIRMGIGVYVKTRPNTRINKMVPRKMLEELAEEVFTRLGIKKTAGYAIREYNAGRSTQVPPWYTVDTGKRIISRKLSLGLRNVRYENCRDAPRKWIEPKRKKT